MRAKCLIGLGLLAMLAASCALDAPSAPEQGLYPSITAGFDNGATKVSVDEAGDVVWNEGDKIALFYHNVGALCYVLEEGAGSTSGTFGYSNGADGGSTIPYICGFYPYAREVKLSTDGEFSFQWPAVQAYAENSFAPGSNPMVAVSQEPSLYFRNLGGYLVLPLWGEASVKSITLCGAAGEPLAGPAVAYASPYEAPEVWMDDDAVGEVVLTCKEPVTVGETEDEATRFWFVLPPTRFEEGFGIKITYADGEEKEFWANDQEEIYQIYRNEVFEMAPLCITQKEPVEVPYLFSEDFEDGFEEERMPGWTFIDSDGDDFNWKFKDNSLSEVGVHIVHSGDCCLYSESYSNDSDEALYPDNWAITPAFRLSSVENHLSFWVIGQDPAYSAEHFAAYIIAGEPTDDIDDYTLLVEKTSTGTYTQITAEIPAAFNGEVVHLLFRHFNVSDQFIINLDDIEVTGEGSGPDIPDDPDDPEEGTILFWEGFEGYSNEDEVIGWTFIDADEDGRGWFTLSDEESENNFAHSSGDGHLTSASYQGVALSPDNWAITPPIKLASADNYLSFWVAGQDPSWAKEHYAVYVTTVDPEEAEAGDYTCLFEETFGDEEPDEIMTAISGESVHRFILQIPEGFDGETVYIAFRHYDCYDMFRLNLDDVMVTVGVPTIPYPTNPSPAPGRIARKIRKVVPAHANTPVHPAMLAPSKNVR